MVVTCPLCGFQFDRSGDNICAGCPINRGCEKICCPNCRYGWIDSSAIVGFFSSLFRKRKKNIGRP